MNINNSWNELGPYYIEEVTGHYAVGLGRVEAFYIDPLNDDRIFLGSRSGGFWKTNNGGETWTNSTDFLIASGVNTIAVSPFDSQKILINVKNLIMIQLMEYMSQLTVEIHGISQILIRTI